MDQMSTLGSFRLALFLVFPLLLVSACRGADDTLPEPIVHTPEGDFTHSGTNIVFPEFVGDFERVEVAQYDESGDDISAGYNLESPDVIAATVFIYPGRKVVDLGGGDDAIAAVKDLLEEGAFEGAKEAILAGTPGLPLVSEDAAFVITNPSEQIGRRAIFEGPGMIEGNVIALRTEVDLFGLGDWFIKYRFTYSGESPTATTLVLDFMNRLQWQAD